jgi:hypothetical protein
MCKCNHVLCVKVFNKSDYQPKPRLSSLNHVTNIKALDYSTENCVLLLLFHPVRRTNLIILYCCERAFETVLKSILNFTRHKAGSMVSHCYVAELFSYACLTLSSPQNVMYFNFQECDIKILIISPLLIMPRCFPRPELPYYCGHQAAI